MMTVQEWIAVVDTRRDRDVLLGRGAWHGYTVAGGSGVPMRGYYYLVRWEQPTIAISGDDPEDLFATARVLESALGSS